MSSIQTKEPRKMPADKPELSTQLNEFFRNYWYGLVRVEPAPGVPGALAVHFSTGEYFTIAPPKCRSFDSALAESLRLVAVELSPALTVAVSNAIQGTTATSQLAGKQAVVLVLETMFHPSATFGEDWVHIQGAAFPKGWHLRWAGAVMEHPALPYQVWDSERCRFEVTRVRGKYQLRVVDFDFNEKVEDELEDTDEEVWIQAETEHQLFASLSGELGFCNAYGAFRYEAFLKLGKSEPNGDPEDLEVSALKAETEELRSKLAAAELAWAKAAQISTVRSVVRQLLEAESSPQLAQAAGRVAVEVSNFTGAFPDNSSELLAAMRLVFQPASRENDPEGQP